MKRYLITENDCSVSVIDERTGKTVASFSNHPTDLLLAEDLCKRLNEQERFKVRKW